jgi:parallel beta-helix repeat protein
MSNTPRYIGFLDAPYAVTLTDDSGAAINLTGCSANSFSLTMINQNTGQFLTGVGVWTITNATTGQASYQYASADLASVGLWLHYVTVKLPAEPSPREFDPDPIMVLAGTVGAGAAPPGVLPSGPASALYFNVRDYGALGDSTDQTAAINATFTAANSAGGGTVYFPHGTYLYSSDLIVPSNTNVLGAGRSTILQAAAACQANCFNVANASHITISDLQLNGNKANVAQIGIQYTKLSGIWGQNSDDITVIRCTIHDCYVSGIMMNGNCTNLKFDINQMTNNFDNQIYVRAKNTTPYTPCSNITMAGNICSGGSYSGIQVLGSSNITFDDNVCYNNGPTAGQGDGIGSEGSSYVTFNNNVLYNNGVQGIQTRFTNEVGTNQISSHVVIANNVCYGNINAGGDNGGIGINDTDDVLVNGNLVYGNQFGINVNGGNGQGVTNCKIVNNKVRGNADTGIRITPGNASTFIVENNESTDNGGDNLYANVRVHIIGGVYARSATNKEGIHFATGSDGSLIKNAEIFDNADNGILIDSGPANIDIRDCLFDNITTALQKRSLQEQAGAGPTRMTNCRIKNQATNPYTFNHVQSRYYDEQTLGQTTTTTSYTVVANDDLIFCNQSAAITVTLPNPSGMAGRTLTIQDKSGTAVANPITINSASGNINGAASKIINTAYGTLIVGTDGTNWFTLTPVSQAPPFALYDGELGQTSSSVGVANTAYLVGVYLPAPATLTAIRVRFAIGGNGHYDVGMYDASGANGAPGNLLAHAAATATSLVTSAATLTPAMISNVNLAPGRYWLALWVDNAVDTFNKQSGSGNVVVVQSGTNAGPLPALASNLAGLANGALKPLLIGLLSGGWS